MSTSLVASPTRVAGHHVKGSLHVSTGFNNRYMVYVLTPSSVAVVEVKKLFSDQGDLLSIPAKVLYVENPAQEEISLVKVHPTQDWLCVGTVAHGLYVTSVTAPVLTKATRIPLSVSGEQAHSACFTSSGSLHMLAFSSSFKSRKGQSPHRLSLWDLEGAGLLWRGAMDVLEAMCGFPGEASFAACTLDKVSLFSLQRSETKEGAAGSSEKPKVVVLSRQCSVVDELKGCEYADCTSSNNPADTTFIAMTAGGFLVAFDKQTGSVVRWMDCKVYPARSVSIADNYVFLSGILARVFHLETWEFKGKIKPDRDARVAASSYLSELLGAVYTATVYIGLDRVVLFSACGDIAVHRMTGLNEGSSKLHFQKEFYFAPVPQSDSEIQYLMSHGEDSTWAVATSSALGIYSSNLKTLKILSMSMSASLYISEENLVLCCCSTTPSSSGSGTHTLVAYTPADGWREWARVDLSLPFISMASNGFESVGLFSEGNKVRFLQCRWEVLSTESRSLVIDFPKEFKFSTSDAIGHVVMTADGKVYGFSQSSMYDASGKVVSLAGTFVTARAFGADVVLCTSNKCMRYKPNTKEMVPICAFERIVCLSCHHEKPIIALANSDEIQVYDLAGESKPRLCATIVHNVSAAAGSFSAIRSLQWFPERRVVVSDAAGRIMEYAVPNLSSHDLPPLTGAAATTAGATTAAPPAQSGRSRQQQRLERRQRRSVSANIPSAKELSDRFDVLSGYYATQKTTSENLDRTRSPRAGQRRVRSTDPHARGEAFAPPENVASPYAKTNPAKPSAPASTAREGKVPPPPSFGVDVPPVTAATEAASGDFKPTTPPRAAPQQDGNAASAPNIPLCASPMQQLPQHNESSHSVATDFSIVYQAKQLKQSLLQIKDLLERDAADETLLNESTDDEIDELADLLTSVAVSIQSRRLRASGNLAAHVDPSSTTPSGDRDRLISELVRMQKQNTRLEAQNKVILERLSGQQ